MSTEVWLAIIAAIAGGIGYVGKWALNRNDKKFEQKLEERNRERERIEAKIKEIEDSAKEFERKLKHVLVIISKCSHENCPTKQTILQEFFSEDTK